MTESAAAGDDDVAAAKAAASEGVTSMTDRVTIINNREECSPLVSPLALSILLTDYV